MVKVKIINESGFELPEYATCKSAGLDLRACISENIILKPFERKLISTGIKIQLPDGYEAQIRPRSGLALKHGISIVNTPGTIDSDYTGIISVILINLSNENFLIKPGERICQMIINKYEQAILVEVKTLDKTERGDGGFGHSGK